MPDLSGLNITIAVTGLKTGDNPQPGVPVIRSIRAAGFSGKIIGLVYDALESGIYYPGLADEIYQLSYPSTGADVFLARLDYILSKTRIDVIIPTLDSEIPLYIRLATELQERGIHTFLPSEEQFNLRDKIKLSQFFPPLGVDIPPTHIIDSVDQLIKLDKKMDYPVFVKGRLYEAYKARNLDEAIKYFHNLQSQWGLPVIVQEQVLGDEFNVVIVGDGKGDCIGLVPQRKLVITDKGKGFGGVVVNNPELERFARKIIQALSWRGPCELEIMKGKDGKFYLIEINPRFPAWVRLAEGSGQNQPAATVLLAMGQDIEPLPSCQPGTLFIRHAEDIISNIGLMGELSVNGELINTEDQ
ncbi:MAG TPA: ATP-grasp domain-containing protein [Candidatus Cloacimonadota bacterium]|mgnify:CR=1 FL=1|nr:ATP-grasp domain-containing protein [Candidatus Cloacimonadota bacterium]